MDYIVVFARVVAVVFGFLMSIIVFFYAAATLSDILNYHQVDEFWEIVGILFLFALMVASMCVIGSWYIGG
jgi:hypothetical protein